MKKILYITPYFVPAWSYGGTVKVSYDFAKGLAKEDYDVTVATTDVLDSADRNPIKHERIDGINVIRFKNVSNHLAKRFNLYTPIGFKDWLIKNICNYDAVHIHEIFTYQTVITGQICQKFHIPYLIQPHGSLSQFAKHSRFYLMKKLFFRIFQSLINSSYAIIALNEKEKADIGNLFPLVRAKINIVPNGLDLDEFTDIKKIDIRKKYHLTKNVKVVVFLGRLHFIKGVDLSLRVLSELKDRVKLFFLIIGPDEGEKNNLIKLAQELKINNQVAFTGLLSGKEKLGTLKSSDISLLLSRSEGMPTTLLESAALGLPIVCSTQCNFPEVEKYQAGFVVSDDIQASEKIEQLLKNGQLRRQLSINAHKLATDFSLTKLIQILINIYESVI